MIETTLEINDIIESNIPGIKILQLKNDDYDIKLEYHVKMGLDFKVGSKVKLVIVESGKDEGKLDGKYCGNAFLYSIKEKNDNVVLLFSIGGLILRIEGTRSILKKGIEVSKEYKFCLK